MRLPGRASRSARLRRRAVVSVGPPAGAAHRARVHGRDDHLPADVPLRQPEPAVPARDPALRAGPWQPVPAPARAAPAADVGGGGRGRRSGSLPCGDRGAAPAERVRADRRGPARVGGRAGVGAANVRDAGPRAPGPGASPALFCQSELHAAYPDASHPRRKAFDHLAGLAGVEAAYELLALITFLVFIGEDPAGMFDQLAPAVANQADGFAALSAAQLLDRLGWADNYEEYLDRVAAGEPIGTPFLVDPLRAALRLARPVGADRDPRPARHPPARAGRGRAARDRAAADRLPVARRRARPPPQRARARGRLGVRPTGSSRWPGPTARPSGSPRRGRPGPTTARMSPAGTTLRGCATAGTCRPARSRATTPARSPRSS